MESKKLASPQKLTSPIRWLRKTSTPHLLSHLTYLIFTFRWDLSEVFPRGEKDVRFPDDAEAGDRLP